METAQHPPMEVLMRQYENQRRAKQKYYETHKQECFAKTKEYYHAHREEICRKRRERYLKHKEAKKQTEAV